MQSITRLTGTPPIRAELGVGHFDVTVPYDYRIEWSSGNYCCYNLRFAPTRAGVRNSWSVRLRPDIALWIEAGEARGFHVFDAKFKLRKLAGWSPDEAKARGDELDEQRGDSHNPDLHKMHTYRDALPDVRSARVLYPGTVARWFASAGADASSVDGVCGVGAVPLLPGHEHAALGAVLRPLLAASSVWQRPGYPPAAFDATVQKVPVQPRVASNGDPPDSAQAPVRARAGRTAESAVVSAGQPESANTAQTAPRAATGAPHPTIGELAEEQS